MYTLGLKLLNNKNYNDTLIIMIDTFLNKISLFS